MRLLILGRSFGKVQPASVVCAGRTLPGTLRPDARELELTNVLVVDDDPDVRLLCRVNLEAEGFAVEEAVDGESGLALAHGGHPDAVVLDVVLPGIDGWAVLAALRAGARTADIPVVLVTAETHERHRARAADAGVSAYLPKPFAPRALVEAVREALQRAAAAGAAGQQRHELTASSAHAAQRLAAIVDSSDDAIISKTLDGIIESWNKAAERIYGYSAEEAIGQPISMLVPAGHEDEVPQFLARIARGERVDHFETVRLRKDGTRIHVSLTISPIRDADGNVVAASVVARDVTDRKRADEAVMDAYARERHVTERLRELDRMKSDFLSTVSHELRTPLTTIKGFAETVAARWPQLPDERRLDFIKRIAVAADHLDRLIGDLLDFTRLERGQLAVELRPHDVRALVEKTLAKLAVALDDAVIETEVPERLSVLADADAFARAFENIALNAVKFSPPGAPVRVEAGESNGKVIVRVRDRGVGVPEADAERIFERFYRVAGTGARGTGIGLAIVKQFVEAQRGSVWVEPNPGGGSVFSIALQRVPP